MRIGLFDIEVCETRVVSQLDNPFAKSGIFAIWVSSTLVGPVNEFIVGLEQAENKFDWPGRAVADPLGQ